MDKALVCTFFIGLLKYGQTTVNITDLEVPESIKLGSTDEVILDCNYEADDNDEDLVIKWFYNGDSQIYQWIPDYRKYGAQSEFWKERLVLDFNITNDANTMYRALKIQNISRDLSGNYTCKVSSLNSEDSKTKQLIVYSPAKSDLDIILFKTENIVICTVHGISPEPRMDFYIKAENGSRTDVIEEVESTPDEDGFYNVTAKHHFQNITLPKLTIFVCNLSIPGTDYVLTKTWELRNENSNITEIDIEEEYVSLLPAEDDNSTFVENATDVHNSNKFQDESGSIRFNYSYVSLLLALFAFFSK